MKIHGNTRMAAGAALLLALLVLTGCSTTRPVAGHETLTALDEIKYRTADDQAVIRLVDGRKMKGTRIHGDLEEITWQDPDDFTAVSVPTGDIDSITLVSHGRGAAQGLGLGALCGAVLGGVAGYSGGDDEGSFLAFSAEQKAGMGAVGGVAAGGLVGVLAGGASGSKTVYEFHP